MPRNAPFCSGRCFAGRACLRLLAALLAVAPATQAAAQCPEPPVQVARLSTAMGNQFGSAVAIGEDFIVIGSQWESSGTGAAYVYDAHTGAFVRRLTANDGAAFDLFGGSVAVSGALAVIGAPGDDDGANGTGSAYVFDVASGTQLRKLGASDRAQGDNFGNAVALDGVTAVIGAFKDDRPGLSDAGAAYVFNVTTGEELFKLTASDATSGADFGHAVGVGGSLAVVGTHKVNSNTGVAYVFDLSTGTQVRRLINDDAAMGDFFGYSVGVSEGIAVVGAYGQDVPVQFAGAAYLFNATSGQQLHKLVAADGAFAANFGWSVGISGGLCVVGASGAVTSGTASGAAYLFDVATGAELHRFSAADAAAFDYFGDRVAIAGLRVVAGAYGAVNNSGAAYLFEVCPEVDSDGDGLLDDWEINGIPYTGAGGESLRFMLPGADPMHKDLYVEVDAMVGFPLSDDAVEYVQLAFSTAPLSNPDGSEGVTLHILRDEVDIPAVAAWQTDGCWPLDFDTYRQNRYGTAAERADPASAALLEAKAKAYRYCIASGVSGPRKIGGCGQTPGDNFVVFINGYDDLQQAAVFMHELGHCLGLKHGGCDDINGKPNYPSIMNYAMSYRYAWNEAFWRLDFSRADAGAMAQLDESSLNEVAGIGSPGSLYADFYMPFGVSVPLPDGTTERQVRYVRLDGSATDFGSDATLQQDGLFEPSVAQDLNYAVDPPPPILLPGSPSAGQTLKPWDDWANVGLRLAAAIGPGAPAPSYPMDEIGPDDIAWINGNFPMPPVPCPADWNGDGLVNSNDISAFLTAWLGSVQGGTLVADFNNDNVVNSNDISAFITAWLDAVQNGC